MSVKTFDVIIVGGGVAGCAAGIALKRLMPELTVCMLERDSPANADDDTYTSTIRPRIGETLPPQVSIPMQQLGIWAPFRRAGWLKSAGTQAAWGAAQPHVNEYIYSPYGNGWHLDRRQFDALLLMLARQQGVLLYEHSQLLEIGRQSQHWRLQLRTTAAARGMPELNTMTARFVVDASGRGARVAQRLGIHKQVFDSLVGSYRFYAAADSHQAGNHLSDSSTMIESVADGWWYCAGLPDNTRVSALMTDADLARANQYAHSAAFDQALAATHLISARLAGLSASTAPIITAAHTQCLEQLAGNGWLATGDAAFTYDPLSSLGIFKALRMALLASYAVKDYFNGKDRELAKYNHLGKAEFTHYLDKRREYYHQETRYTQNPFWQRRLAA